MGNQTFIEINGKKYDAVTGRIIHDSPVHAAKTVIQAPISNKVVDGFVKRPKTRLQSSSAHHLSKQPQKSQTLARAAVKKPLPKATVAPLQKETIAKPSLKTPVHRVVHAHTVKQSPHIKKFNHLETPRTSVVKRHEALTVAQPKPVHASSASTQLQTYNQPQSVSASQKLIEAALSGASTHTEPEHQTKKRRRSLSKRFGISPKVAAVSSAVLAAVLLGGFFALQNVPNLSMRVASARAGFDATMPGYQPSGFSFTGPINYKSGQVRVSFKSNVDNREYAVTQTSSNWNSDSLLANFITTEKKQYQTYLDKGRTLYIYDGSNATWVDNGIWYQIEGNSSLTTDQLIRIASSL